MNMEPLERLRRERLWSDLRVNKSADIAMWRVDGRGRGLGQDRNWETSEEAAAVSQMARTKGGSRVYLKSELQEHQYRL